MNQIVDDGHLKAARRFRELCAVYEEHRDLITVGAYERGADPLVDLTSRTVMFGWVSFARTLMRADRESKVLMR